MRIILLIILQLFVFQIFSQETLIDNKWLIILSGYETENEALAMKEKYEFKTSVLNSSNYENLNPGWFINCVPFELQTDAEKESLLLKDKGFNNYIKYSGTYTGILTASVINITGTSAVSGGNIGKTDGLPFTENGICWSKDQYPTINDCKSKIGEEKGIFIGNMVGLSTDTKYYIRAYAINKNDTIYGNQIAFTTKDGLPEITTNDVRINGNTTAQCGGNITSDGGFTISVRGVCWSKSQNPTIASNKTINDTGMVSFINSVTGLTPATKYYIRAYATNSKGTSYGEQKVLITNGIGDSVNDVDGNIYSTIWINGKLWLKENLKTTKFNDGTAIPLVTKDSIWCWLKTPAYCWYNNDTTNKKTYGALYNWYTVNTGKLCPADWHVPTDFEWKTLEKYLGMTQVQADAEDKRGTNQGSKLAGNISLWKTGALKSNSEFNISGFTALPGGCRIIAVNIDLFARMGGEGNWWTATKGTEYYTAFSRSLWYYNTQIFRISRMKEKGLSVRCVKDN